MQPATWWQVAVFSPSPPKEASDAMTQAVFRVNRVSMAPPWHWGKCAKSRRMACRAIPSPMGLCPVE